MAEIPVEKKSGIPWWGWLLALLALIAVAAILWLSLADDDDPDTTEVVVPVVSEAPGDGAKPVEDGEAEASGKITSITMLRRGSLSGLVGTSVSLDNITVDSLAGDMSFYINDSSDEKVFVAFEEIPTPGNPAKEGKLDINPGTVLNLDGTIMAADADKPDNVDIDLPEGTDAYIFARDIKIVR